MSESHDDECKHGDVCVLGPTTDQGTKVIRHRPGHQLELGILQPLKEGRPVQGELVKLTPRKGSPVCDVESFGKPGIKKLKGPVQVSSPAYRKGWGRVFGKNQLPN